MKKSIDFYYPIDSNYHKNFNAFLDKSIYDINYICINNIKSKKIKSNIIIFEEESFITSIDLFKTIIKNYSDKPVCIIISNNTDIFNVVQWIREGAIDYLIKQSVNENVLYNSLSGALDFNINKKNNITLSDKKAGKSIIKNKQIIVPKNVNWNELDDDCNYELSLCLFEINFFQGGSSRYSKESMEKIYSAFINESGKIANSYGGRLWYHNSNSGALLFFSGDHVNCAVLSAISIFNNLFFICYESLKLQELLSIKIILHSGCGLYNSKNTTQITSDLINSSTHLIKLFTENNTFNITEDVYNKLNPRLTKNFIKTNTFEKRKIYKYIFFKY